MESYQDEILAPLQAAKQLLAETQEAANAYYTQLNLAHERFDKLPRIQRVDRWLSTQQAIFEAADYGESIGATEEMLASFEESYASGIEGQRNVRLA